MPASARRSDSDQRPSRSSRGRGGIGAAAVAVLAAEGRRAIAVDRAGDDRRLRYAMASAADLEAVVAAANEAAGEERVRAEVGGVTLATLRGASSGSLLEYAPDHDRPALRAEGRVSVELQLVVARATARSSVATAKRR